MHLVRKRRHTSFRRCPASARAFFVLVACGAAVACTDDDDTRIIPGGAGAAAGNGTGGRGGAGSSAGGAAGGSATPAGPSGVVTVLADDQSKVVGAATGAFRGADVWFTNFQVANLFLAEPAPQLPFTVRSVPVAGGAVGAAEIELEGDFYPEGIAATPGGVLFIGSVTTGVIVRVPADSVEAEPFVDPGVAERGVVGLTVDSDRGLLWFCDSGLGQSQGSALVGVSLANGAEVVRHALPSISPGAPAPADAGGGADAAPGPDAAPPDASAPDASADAGGPDASTSDAGALPADIQPFCNDVIVDPSGRILLTDSVGGRVVQIASADVMVPDSASVWLNDPALGAPGGFGANGLELIGGTLVVANGGLIAIDTTSANPASTIADISLVDAQGVAVALCGPDGLAAVPGSSDELIVVENGSCRPGGLSRVVKISLTL